MKKELGGEKTGRWERNRGSVGGKAKQVYVEKMRKWGSGSGKQRYGNKGESSTSKKRSDSWRGLNFWGKHTNQRELRKNFRNA